MSIKGAIKRLEGVLARNSGSKAATFVIPYCRDKKESIETQQKLIREYDLENSNALVVFVISYATAA